MFELVANPFKYVAGWQSVAVGVLVMCVTALAASLNGTHFPDVLSLKVGLRLSFGALLVQWFANWATVALVMYVAGLLFSSSRPRFVDVLGTQGMARLPYFFASFLAFVPALEKLGNMLVNRELGMGEPVQMAVPEIALAVVQLVLTILFTVWMVAWMYRAFSVSVNLKGGKAVGVFTGALFVSMLLSMGLFWLMANELRTW